MSNGTEPDPKLPQKKEDEAQAKKDVAKIEAETFALKLSAKKDYKEQLRVIEAKIKAGAPAGAGDLADVKMKIVDVNEKIMKEILHALGMLL
jgi:hypothetical protein